MAKFVAVLEQAGEGCDYMIGCGTKVHVFEADDMAAAFELLKHKAGWSDYEMPGESPSYLISGEGELASAVIYEVAQDDGGASFTDWLGAASNKAEQHEAEVTLAAKRAQLRKLKEELGEA